MDYYCACCHSEAFVVDGAVVRTCSHESSTIIAPRTSELFGDGGASEKSLAEQAIDAIYTILRSVSDGFRNK